MGTDNRSQNDNHNQGDKPRPDEKQNPNNHNQDEQRKAGGTTQNPQNPKDMGKKSGEQSHAGQQGHQPKH